MIATSSKGTYACSLFGGASGGLAAGGCGAGAGGIWGMYIPGSCGVLTWGGCAENDGGCAENPLTCGPLTCTDGGETGKPGICIPGAAAFGGAAAALSAAFAPPRIAISRILDASRMRVYSLGPLAAGGAGGAGGAN